MPFVDDELEPARARDVGEHLEKCDHCKAEVEAMRAYDARVKGACCSEESAGPACCAMRERLNVALDECIAADARRAQRRHTLRRAAAILVAGMLAIAIEVGFLPARPAAADLVADHEGCSKIHDPYWIADEGRLATLCRDCGGDGAAVVSLADAGYARPRGRLCAFDGRTFVHLFFEANGRAPVSVFVGQGFLGLAGWLRGRAEDYTEYTVVRVRGRDGAEYFAVVPRAGAEAVRAALERQASK